MDDSDDGVKVSLVLSFPLECSIDGPSSCRAHNIYSYSRMSLTNQALATKSLAELLYPPTGSGQNTSLLVDIVSEYHGNSRSLENAVQKVSL